MPETCRPEENPDLRDLGGVSVSRKIFVFRN